MGFISTTALAKKLNIDRNELASQLIENGMIKVENGSWQLTQRGMEAGGRYRDLKEGGRYIVWPTDLDPDRNMQGENDKSSDFFTVSRLANEFGVSASRLNLLFSEMGWIERDGEGGWRATSAGRNQGGTQKTHNESGSRFVIWPKDVLQNRILINLCRDISAEEEETRRLDSQRKQEERINKFRHDLPGQYRTKDGHWVRSRAEVIIDDALYYYQLPHAYERRVPIEEEMYSDFFLPQQQVYIEFWGYEKKPEYIERKRKKQELYTRYALNLIELDDTHIKNLDDHLPVMLMRYGIRVF